jgi:hypothetical protein
MQIKFDEFPDMVNPEPNRALKLLNTFNNSSLGYQSVPRPSGVESSTVPSAIGSGAPRRSCPGSADQFGQI